MDTNLITVEKDGIVPGKGELNIDVVKDKLVVVSEKIVDVTMEDITENTDKVLIENNESSP